MFDSEIYFIFENGASKTKLKHNAPSLLHALFIDNIKRRCVSMYPKKQQGFKVVTLFGDMTMLYLLKIGSRPGIICVTGVASAINTNLKNLVSGTSKNYAAVYFSCSSVFLCRAGMIDELDMD